MFASLLFITLSIATLVLASTEGTETNSFVKTNQDILPKLKQQREKEPQVATNNIRVADAGTVTGYYVTNAYTTTGCTGTDQVAGYATGACVYMSPNFVKITCASGELQFSRKIRFSTALKASC